MFTKLKDGRIKSEAGFTLKVLGRAGLEYREGSKTLLVDSEMLADKKIGFAVASSSINYWKGSRKKIEKKDQLRILNNIKEAIRFIGYEIKVIDRF